jgi:membrane-bound serine protease (ClpP class)
VTVVRAVLISIFLFGLFYSLLFSLSAASSPEKSAYRSALLVEIAPPWDTIDSGVAECVVEAVEAAEREGAVLIIKVDSYGGYLDAAFTIGDRLYDAKTPIVAYVENKALSAGTLVLLPADLIVAKQGAVIGAMQPVAVNPVTGEITFLNESKIIEPILRKAEVYAERAGRNVSLIREFIVKARTERAETALEYRVVDRVVSGFEELLEVLRDYNLTRLNATYRLEISRGGVRSFACSLRSRLLSVLLNPYLANALISIGVLATIFALVSERLTILPLTITLILLGLLGTGLNPNIVSAFLVVLGVALLAVELFILPGFGVMGISGIVLLTLGFALLPLYIPTGALPPEEYISTLRVFVIGFSVVLGSFFGFVLFKVIEVKRQRPYEFTPRGKVGVVIEDVKPGSIGFVKVEGEIWRATSTEEIRAGEEVVVLEMRSDGVLVVKKKS